MMKPKWGLGLILLLVATVRPLLAQETGQMEEWTDMGITAFYAPGGELTHPLVLDHPVRFRKDAVRKAYDQMRYPAAAREQGIHGTVRILVELGEHGQYVRARVSGGIGSGCNEEALFAAQKIIRAGTMPAEANGIPVPVVFEMPIEFTMH